MKNSTAQIGDGKLPNKYWVFQYDQKHQNRKNEDGSISLEIIKEDQETENSLLGVFNSYNEALQCVDNRAYLPNVVIEDRISGQVFEQMCIVCPCCGRENYESFKDISYTQKVLGTNFK